MENAVGDWYVKQSHYDIFGPGKVDVQFHKKDDWAEEWLVSHIPETIDEMIEFFQSKVNLIPDGPHEIKIHRLGEFECIIEYTLGGGCEGIGGTMHYKKM